MIWLIVRRIESCSLFDSTDGTVCLKYPIWTCARLSSSWDISRRRMAYTRSLKPQSHQIVRLLDRTSGWDWTSATDRQCLQRSPATRSISTVTNDWRISMARAIVGNRATSGSDQRPMYDQSCRPAIDRCILRPIVRSNGHHVSDRTSTLVILWLGVL